MTVVASCGGAMIVRSAAGIGGAGGGAGGAGGAAAAAEGSHDGVGTDAGAAGAGGAPHEGDPGEDCAGLLHSGWAVGSAAGTVQADPPAPSSTLGASHADVSGHAEAG